MKMLIALSLLLGATISFAQSEPPTPTRIVRTPVQPNGTDSSTLKSNYNLTLTASEKDKPATVLSFVTASNRFEAASGDTFLAFKGNIVEQSDTTLLVTYSLNISIPVPIDTGGGQATVSRNIEYRSSGVQSGAIVTLDQPLKIFSSGNRDYTLTVSKTGKEK